MTAQCIASQIIHRMDQSRCPVDLGELQRLTSTLTSLTLTEFSLVHTLDSVQIGTASLLLATKLLEGKLDHQSGYFSDDLHRNLSIITKMSRREINRCMVLIENLVGGDMDVPVLKQQAPFHSPRSQKYAKTCNEHNSITTTPTDLLSMVVI